MKTLKKFEIKGNEIDAELHKKFKQNLPENLEYFEAYSEDEIDLDELENVEKISKQIEDISLNKY